MDILLIGLSFLYIFLVIGFSIIIFRKNQGELSRKFIHIMVGNWIFISVFFYRCQSGNIRSGGVYHY